MTQVKTITRSFAGGEIGDELAGRLDLNKFQTGVARSLNFEALPHGPLQNRAGFAHVLETKFSHLNSVLIPFVYNAEQAYELEFGDQYVRVHTQAGTLLNTALSITSMTFANPGVFTRIGHGLANGQWVFTYMNGSAGLQDSMLHRYFKIANATADTFQLTDLYGTIIDTSGMGGFFHDGTVASVFEIVSPYVEADLGELNITQSNDVLTITHPLYQTRELRRLSATNWTFTIIATSPVIAAPTAPALTKTGAGAGTKYGYKVTTISAGDVQEESLASIPAIASSTNITGVTNANPGVVTSVAHGRAVGDYVYVASVGGMTQLAGEYIVNTVPGANTVTLKTLGGVVVDTTAFGVYTAGGTLGYTEIDGSTSAGDRITITWTPAANAVRYNVYRRRSGVWAYVGQATGASFTDDNITPDTSQTPPEANDPFAGVNNYPRAAGYFQGRRWFGGSNLKPQNLWATRSGTESNMAYSIPTRDNDSISVRLTSRQANTIRHIIPLRDLLLLTSGAEWSVSAGNGTTITPSNIDYTPQGYVGAAAVIPVVTSDAVIYVQDRGGRVREMLYSWEKSGYKTNDICVMAPHLFDGYTIVSMAYVRVPHPMIFCVRSDGVMLGLTYMPEHQVAAWHWHNTNGLFKSVVGVPEGNEDVLYAIIERTINGRTARFVERKHTRRFSTLEDSFFVDCGVTYDGLAVTVINGLHHLEGEEVTILADGAVHPSRTVVGGQITLEEAASLVHIGLSYTADIHTLPMSFEAAAFGQAKTKNISNAFLRVVNTSGLRVGHLGKTLSEAKQRTTEPYGSPPGVFNREVKVDLRPGWDDSGQIHIQQALPLPTMILSLTLEASVGGN